MKISKPVKTLNTILLFIVANVALVILHINLFQSSIPFFAWVSMAAHFYLLTYILIRKLSKTNKNDN